MSGDYVERLRQLVGFDASVTRLSLGADRVRDLEAALDELEQLRAERSDEPKARCTALSSTRLSLQCSRPEGHDAAHVADLDGMGRFSWHGA